MAAASDRSILPRDYGAHADLVLRNSNEHE